MKAAVLFDYRDLKVVERRVPIPRTASLREVYPRPISFEGSIRRLLGGGRQFLSRQHHASCSQSAAGGEICQNRKGIDKIPDVSDSCPMRNT